jgi:hypothetical protein
LIDNIECENWPGVATVFSTWIFGEDQRVIGGLIDRRREETQLFLEEIKNTLEVSGDILLRAFRNYTATGRQINAIRRLEEQVNPYVLAAFANAFFLDDYSVDYPEDVRLLSMADNWS